MEVICKQFTLWKIADYPLVSSQLASRVLRNGQLARRKLFRPGNLVHILFGLCPPMPFRLFNTLFARLLKSQMSKNVPRLIAWGSLAASRGHCRLTFALRRLGNPRIFLFISYSGRPVFQSIGLPLPFFRA